jgi:hypothetical protein
MEFLYLLSVLISLPTLIYGVVREHPTLKLTMVGFLSACVVAYLPIVNIVMSVIVFFYTREKYRND